MKFLPPKAEFSSSLVPVLCPKIYIQYIIVIIIICWFVAQ